MNPRTLNRDERGFALMLAMLVLFVLSLLGALLMASVVIERKVAGHDQRSMQALDIAEAGVGEVTSRLAKSDIVLDTANPRSTGQIFLTTAGSVPVPGADTIAVETKQPIGQWLTYSTPTPGPNVLTVNWYTDAAQTVIYRYDPTKNPAIQTTTGSPIYVVHATGTKGSAQRSVETELVAKPYITNTKAAFAADQGIDFSGNSDVCGHNHSINTPIGTRIPACNAYDVGSGDLPGSWSSNTVTSNGSSTQQGVPTNNAQNQTGFYTGPWDALGMSQSDFFSWIGNPYVAAPNPPTGLIYLDNDGIAQNQSGGYSYNGGNGEGMLYVDGDLHINGNFTFKGLIYVEGNLDINGTCWILGGMIVRGKSRLGIANGTFTLLYSSDAISQELSKYSGQFTRLSWREVP